MPNRPARITQAEIARALKAAQAAGLPVARFEVLHDGGLRVVVASGGANDAINEWDAV